MKITRTLSVAFLCLAIASPLAARERPRATSSHPEKKDAGLVLQPIKPMEPRDEKEKPRAGWNGLYGGLNAGGGFGDTENR